MGFDEVRWCDEGMFTEIPINTDAKCRTFEIIPCSGNHLVSPSLHKPRKFSHHASFSTRVCTLLFMAILVLLPSDVHAGSVSAELAKTIDDDLTARNISIYPEHICHIGEKRPRLEEDWNDRGCLCDQACAIFGDCCRDVRSGEQSRSDISCVTLRHYDGIYMITSCPKDYRHEEVTKLCAEPAPLIEDPFGGMPVSSPPSRFTYRNYYCAMCHDDVSDMVFWKSRVECPTLKNAVREKFNVTDKFTAQNLQQNAQGEWGVTLGEGAIETFHPCEIDPFFPETVEYFVRRCRENVDTCLANWTGTVEEELCLTGYTAFVYDYDNKAYRNPHCALCNDIPPEEQFSIKRPMFRSGLFGSRFNGRSFSILLDIGDSSGSEHVGSSKPCSDIQLWDPFFKKCRDVVCDASGYKLVDGECVVDGNATTDGNFTRVISNSTTATPFLLCPKYYLASSEYERADNDSVYVPLYDRHYRPGEYELRDGELVVCAITDDLTKFDHILSYISLICLAASVICLLLHLMAFCCVPEIRNLSGKNLAALALCLLVGYVCFLVGPQLEVGTFSCKCLGIGMYAAFIASFFWMNVMAFDVFTTLRRATKELRMSSDRHLCRIICYTAYVIIMTSALVLAAVLSEDSPNVAEPYQPAFGSRVCWFSRRRALLAFFAAPLVVIMAVNLVFFIASAHMIRVTTNSTAKMTCGPSQVNLKLYSRLAVIMGLSWIVGLVAGWLDFSPLWYIFVILNALQGVFIFVSFTMAKKVKDRMSKRVEGWSSAGPNSGASRSLADSHANTDSSALSVQQRTRL